MNNSRRFILGVCAAWSAVLLMPSMVGLAQRGPVKPLVDATNKRMQPEDVVVNGNGIVTIPVFGDASKPGMYIVRNRFPAGMTSRPHYHDQDRFVTVIKGTWWTDEGDVFRADKMVPVKTGGLMFHPAGFHHYDGAKGEEVIVQIMGMGPVKTIQTEVDASGKPVGSNPAAAPR